MGNLDKTNARILIVDDEPAIRGLLDAILSEKYTCTTAGSAEEALDFLQNQNFDLVLSDFKIEGMSGIELFGHVGTSSPDAVAMAARGNQAIDSPIEANRYNAFDYIKKPFHIDEVSVAVDRAVRHGASISKREHENHLERLVGERTERVNYLAYHDPITGLPHGPVSKKP